MEAPEGDAICRWRAWDVNDLLVEFWKWLPRRRWISLNTDYFGPFFSASDLVGVPSAELHRILDPIKWLRDMESRSGRYVWLYRPEGHAQPIRAGSLLDTTPKNWVRPLDFDGCSMMSRPGRLGLQVLVPRSLFLRQIKFVLTLGLVFSQKKKQREREKGP